MTKTSVIGAGTFSDYVAATSRNPFARRGVFHVSTLRTPPRRSATGATNPTPPTLPRTDEDAALALDLAAVAAELQDRLAVLRVGGCPYPMELAGVLELQAERARLTESIAYRRALVRPAG